MALPIGITGNIGAGKTTVCRQFERLGVPVYYADARAKALMTDDEKLKRHISTAFGSDVYTSEGLLDRQLLASRVFTDAAKLEQLNALVHPAVAQDAAGWHARQTAPYSLHEAAIIFEIGSEASYHSVIVVSCPLETRFERVHKRDAMKREDFMARADKQWSEEQKIAAADFVIINDGLRLLLPQIITIDSTLRRLLPPSHLNHRRAV